MGRTYIREVLSGNGNGDGRGGVDGDYDGAMTTKGGDGDDRG